jgi:hypothetical protein
MKSTFSGRFVLCGVPRSGTSILGRFLNSIEGFACLQEPIQTKSKFGKVTLPNGDSVDGEPMEIMDELAKTHQAVGFKEPFMIKCYRYEGNAGILQEAKNKGHKFLWIVRDPESVFNSSRRWGGNWEDVELFIQNYTKFFETMGDAPAVVYDKFIVDPIGEVNAKLGLGVTGEPLLAPAKDADKVVACKLAMDSDEINPSKARVILSKSIVQRLKDSGVIDMYLRKASS